MFEHRGAAWRHAPSALGTAVLVAAAVVGTQAGLADATSSRAPLSPYREGGFTVGVASVDRRITITSAEDGSYVLGYTPSGGDVVLDLDLLSGERAQAWWADPSTGRTLKMAAIASAGVARFPVPEGTASAWVLVVDDVAAGYGSPTADVMAQATGQEQGTGETSESGGASGGGSSGSDESGSGGSADEGGPGGSDSSGGGPDGGSSDSGSGGGSGGGGSGGGGSDSGGSSGSSAEDGPGESDGGESDGGESDGGESDGGESDGGESDGGESDGGESDGGESDGGESEAGESDARAGDGPASGTSPEDGRFGAGGGGSSGDGEHPAGSGGSDADSGGTDTGKAEGDGTAGDGSKAGEGGKAGDGDKAEGDGTADGEKDTGTGSGTPATTPPQAPTPSPREKDPPKAGSRAPETTADPAWDELAKCESSGNWGINSGNGYYGGLQFDEGTWSDFGGTKFAPRADQATREQQIEIATKVRDTRGGYGSWPACSSKLGLPT